MPRKTRHTLQVTLGGVLHTRPLACLPTPNGALLGTVEKGTKEWERIAGEAARTIPGCAPLCAPLTEPFG